jgi:hypothetical protein
MIMKSPSLLLALIACCILSAPCHGARFAVNGPVLTVTLKDPAASTIEAPTKWLNLANLRPNLLWSVHSQSRPLPNWLPSLQSLGGTVGYQYEQNRRLPSFVEGDARFSARGVEVAVQPYHEFRSKRTLLLVQVSRGATYVMTKFVRGSLELIRGCYQVDLPYASVGGVRITPTWDVQKGEPSCLLEGTTGSQRTKAVLNLEYQNPTLSVVHALDERYVLYFIWDCSWRALACERCFSCLTLSYAILSF